VLALVVALAALGLQARLVSDPHIRYDRFSLPAFDAYVHVAMAERPAVFTVAPWGYRVLAPAAAAALPGNAVQGFRRLAFLSLLAAAVLLHFFLRRLGLGKLPALLGVAAFALSPPVAESLRYVFLDEPLSSALEMAVLLALASGAGTGVLALLLTVWALAKELWPLFIPLVLLREWRRGPRSALAATLAVAAGPLAVTLILREWWWRPPVAPTVTGDAGWLEATAIALASWRQWAGPMLLLGLTPLAVVGALRYRARPFAARYGGLAAILLVVPLFAASYVSGSFFAADVTRLLLYALPLLIALALMTFFPLASAPERPAARAASRGSIAGAAAAAAIVLSLPLLLDRYRRIDLRGARDGPLVLALCRESLQAAQRLERDRPVVLDAATTGYEWGVSPPEEMGRMRWFLREGWGARAHYGIGDVVMQEGRASLLVPCRRPRELEAVLRLDAPSPRPVEVLVNGRSLGERVVGPSGDEAVVRVPGEALFRGDNVLTLSAPDGPGVRFRSLVVRPAP
jgi:hypothetical protein